MQWTPHSATGHNGASRGALLLAWTRSSRAVLLGVALTLATCSCAPRTPILLGFGGPLSGRNADLGNAGLDGVRMAIDEWNSAGGLDGRQVELVPVDDEMNDELARQRDAALLDRGIAAMIGHMTSNASVAVLPLFNQRGVLLISPTASTHDVTGQADCFFRVYPDNHMIAGEVGRRAAGLMGHRTAAIIYETSNASFTLSCKAAFEQGFTAGGGRIVGAVSFKMSATTAFRDLTQKALAADPACLYVLANSMDTAMVCQQVAKMGKRPRIVVSDWSLTDDLLAHGGRAVEGIFAMHTVDRNSAEPRYVAFRQSFARRYARPPEFAALHGYDSARVVLTALRHDPRPANLPRTILAMRRFDGLQGPIEFDQTGDVRRRLYAVRVRGGRFVTER